MNLHPDLLPDIPLLGALYEAPAYSRRWDDVIEHCRKALNGSSCSIFFSWNLGANRQHFHLVDDTHAVGSGMSVRYMETYREMDPVRYDEMQPNEIHQIDDYIDRKQLVQSEYYRDFMRPAGIEFIACLHVSEPGGMRAWLVVSRAKQGGQFKPGDIAFLHSLAPHLERALGIFATLKRTELERAVFSEVAKALTVGTIILNQDLSIIGINPVAEQLISESNNISIQGERLRLTSINSNKEMEALLKSCLDHPNSREPIAMRVPTNDEHFLCLLVKAIPGLVKAIPNLETPHKTDSVPRLILYINDPASNKVAPASIVGTLFGLTPSESALAVLLAGGMSIGEAAREMHINENSARTNLKRIFAKTGLHRQTELVSLILKSLATLGVSNPDLSE